MKYWYVDFDETCVFTANYIISEIEEEITGDRRQCHTTEGGRLGYMYGDWNTRAEAQDVADRLIERGNKTMVEYRESRYG